MNSVMKIKFLLPDKRIITFEKDFGYRGNTFKSSEGDVMFFPSALKNIEEQDQGSAEIIGAIACVAPYTSTHYKILYTKNDQASLTAWRNIKTGKGDENE